MIEARAEIEIAAPLERVFDYVADARNEQHWVPGAERVEMTSPGEVGPGTRFEGEYARAGTVQLELVEFDRPTRLTIRARARIVHFDDAITLTARPDGATHLSAVMTARPQGVMRVATPVMGRAMRRQFTANWTHLKHALESASG